MSKEELEYAGFWIRVGAALIDSLLILVIVFPVLISIYGWNYFDLRTPKVTSGTADFFVSWVFPFLAVVLFWLYRQATPGKIAMSIRIQDANTGKPLTAGQSIGRYFAYYISILPFCLGLIWIAFDKKKQGWHDKLAHTVVVRARAQPS